MKFLKKIFQRKPRILLLDKQYRVTEAFELKGVKYYSFDDAFKIPSARALSALTIYQEFEMRTDKDYLEKHVRAVEILLSDPKKISIKDIALLNNNLKERTRLAPMPEYIYKLASVVFFDDTESPYSYDYKYNAKKIAKWKEAGEVLDFFLNLPLKTLMPYLDTQDPNLKTYFQVAGQVDQLHRSDLQEILSRER